MIVALFQIFKTPDSLLMIESGIGNKLTDKQRKIFRICEEWLVTEDLKKLGIGREDLDFVILTHYDWDHSAGVVMLDREELKLTFPNARHILQKTEWEDVMNPNARSVNTYWPVNVETMRTSGNLELIEGEAEISSGITVSLTGGHTRGHQVVTIRSGNEEAIYLGDLLPTHVHFNPLWITGYDNFPLDSIREKEKLLNRGVSRGAWFVFYQNRDYLACKFDEKGNIIESICPQK